MFTLLLTTALLTHENTTTHQLSKIYPVSKTITFTGKVPYPTCEMDSYSDRKLALLKGPLVCPDNRQVTVKKEPLIVESEQFENVWVIIYEKKS
ncbi:TPA: hypothetical protein RUX44_004158 [Aeromonas hydrophila]|uniref:hypothetical protein n=1 Tax=Aeromonas TaxID=642 RepID=UPI00114CA19B|nr:hypothetical protein [Aeromonas caviae]HDZ8915785.1 hypothetical protein [Aeromonas hydrophila]